MADIQALKAELTTDPLGRGYSTMTDQQVADDLNAVNITRNLSSLSGEVMWQQTDPAEFGALTADKQQMWVSFTRSGGIDPFATANVQFVMFIFGGQSTTVANLAASRTEQVSRAEQLSLLGSSPAVGPAHVAQARA